MTNLTGRMAIKLMTISGRYIDYHNMIVYVSTSHQTKMFAASHKPSKIEGQKIAIEYVLEI